MTDRLSLEQHAEARELATVQRLAAEARAMAPRPIQFVRGDALVQDIRPISWAIRHVLERNTLAAVIADPEAGKTLLQLDWELSIASGRPWNGRPVTKGATFHLCGEGAHGLRRRVHGWSIRHQVALEGLEFYALPVATNLSDPTAALAVGDAVKRLCDMTGVAPVLISIDTLSRHLGADENSTSDMCRFVEHVDSMIREPTGACVAFAHHMGHGDKTRARGSTVLRGALDAEYRMVRDAETGLITLTCTKAKDWPHPPPMHFRLSEVELGLLDDEGMPVTSAVLDPTEAPEAGSREPRARGTNQHKALAVLHRLHREHADRLAADDRDPDTARVLIEDWRRESGLHRNRWPEALAALTERDMVRLDHPYAIPLGRPK